MVDVLEVALDDGDDDDEDDEDESEDAEDDAEEEDAAALALDDAVDSSNGEEHHDESEDEARVEYAVVDLRVLEEGVALGHDASNERQEACNRADNCEGDDNHPHDSE